MTVVVLISSILVGLGAFFMLAAIIQGEQTTRTVPPELLWRWRIMITLMLFFLAGYLLFVVALVSGLRFPRDLITGPVFFGGALFVFIVINLTRETIRKIKGAEEGLRQLNESLERRVAERTQELRSSREFLKTVLDSQQEAVLIIDVDDLKITGANASFLREYGVTEQELIGRKCYEVTHNRSEICGPPDDVCPLLEVMATGDHAMVEHIHEGRHGEKIYVEISASPIRDKDGKIIRIVHIEKNITARRLAEETLRKSEEQLQNILDSIHAGIMVIDPATHTIVYVNTLAADLIGAPKEDIVGRVCHEFVCPAERGKCPITDCDETVDNAERLLIKADGARLPILKSVITVMYGNRMQLIESFIDISGLKKTEKKLSRFAAELKEVNEELRNFAYIVSHDLRAPLVNIKGFSAELRESVKEIDSLIGKYLPAMDEKERKKLEPLLRKDIRESLDFIGSSVTRMDELINSVLTLSRIGRRELKPEPVDMHTLVRSILDSLAHQMEQRRVAVTVSPLPVITADKISMEQIMGNLLDNAVKYLEPERPGELEITAERNGTETIFSVRDNGRGIAEDDIPKVFELFQRVGRRDVPGEGMGLAYVKTLVRRHGGRIWCESEPGRGTTFSFTIPREGGTILK